MNRDGTPRLIVNHQFLRTEWSGGAGTYAEELVARLHRDREDGGAGSRLGRHSLYVLNRPEEWDPPAASPAAAPPAVGRGVHMRRFMAHWLLPTGFHGTAKRTYAWVRAPRLRRHGGPAAAAAPAAPASPLPPLHGFPWETDARCVFHELTGYDAHTYVGHATLNPNLRLCVTFLDIQDYFHPEFFPPEIITQRRRNYAFYKEHASLFFSISEFTKRTMVDLLGIDPDRILVTPLAGDEVAPAGPEPGPGPDPDGAAKAHGRYLIYPAKPWRHKNHATLIDAMGRAADVAREHGLRLLFTGGMSEADKAALMDRARAAGAEDRVEILGFRPRDALRDLLRHAEMLIFPSLFEGFGMPVLEAQALGCPVACSDTTSLPEVAGDAALLFDPLDPDAIARIIADVALGRVDRQGLIDRGRRNVRRFTWDRTYETTLEGYRRLFA